MKEKITNFLNENYYTLDGAENLEKMEKIATALVEENEDADLNNILEIAFTSVFFNVASVKELLITLVKENALEDLTDNFDAVNDYKMSINEDCIFYGLEELCSAMSWSAYDAILAWHNGKCYLTDDYYSLDAYANIESHSYVSDFVSDEDEFYEWIIDYDGCDYLDHFTRELLDIVQDSEDLLEELL